MPRLVRAASFTVQEEAARSGSFLTNIAWVAYAGGHERPEVQILISTARGGVSALRSTRMHSSTSSAAERPRKLRRRARRAPWPK